MAGGAFFIVGRGWEQYAPAGNMDILLVIDKELTFDEGAAGEVDMFSAGEAYGPYLMDAGRIVKSIGIGLIRDVGFRGTGKELEIVEEIPVELDGQVTGFVEGKVKAIVFADRFDLVRKGADAGGAEFLFGSDGDLYCAGEIEPGQRSFLLNEFRGGAVGDFDMVNGNVLPGLTGDTRFDDEVLALRKGVGGGVDQELGG